MAIQICLAALLYACGAAEEESATTSITPELCSTHTAFFVDSVIPILTNNCFSCHQNLVGKFQLADAQQVGVDSSNSINFTRFKSYGADVLNYGANIDGVHGTAGARLTQDTAQDAQDYATIEEMVSRVKNCVDRSSQNGLVLLDDDKRLRKLTLTLAGRLPKPAELQIITQAGADPLAIELGYNQILDDLMSDGMDKVFFLEVIQQIYNDLLLVDAFPDGVAISSFGIGNFANKDMYKDQTFLDAYPLISDRNTLLRNASIGLVYSPLRLVAQIIDNDKPFTDILTADYLLVNPYTAALFNADVGDPAFPFVVGDAIDAHDPWDFRPAKITDVNSRANPHAGILSTSSFLNRYPSTKTNLNRARARVTFAYFLGVDVEGLVDRASLDLGNVVGTYPTFEDPQCKACHDTIDPVAGLFKNWSFLGQYNGDVAASDITKWPNNYGNPSLILAPGYTENQILPDIDSASALQWLAAQIAVDDRFAQTTVKTVFTGLTGQTPPQDSDFIKNVAAEFISTNFDFKTVVKRVINSVYFIADNLDNSGDPNQFQEIGMARLIIPEQLDRKLQALTGYRWAAPESTDNLLDPSYRILYGGIDSLTVTTRTTDPTKIMASIQQRIAFQTSCKTVPQDFAQADKNLRRYFPLVDLTDTPTSTQGIVNIKDNIQFLHRYLLGESIALDSNTLNITYDLFTTVLNSASVTALPQDCRNDLAVDDPVVVDALYTVHAWMAVVAYLLSDYKFLYD